MIIYENAVKNYEDSLLMNLRGHQSDVEILNQWVPDKDIFKSILNMVEAVKNNGVNEFSFSISSHSLDEQTINLLQNALNEHLEHAQDGKDVIIKISGLETYSTSQEKLVDSVVQETVSADEQFFSKDISVTDEKICDYIKQFKNNDVIKSENCKAIVCSNEVGSFEIFYDSNACFQGLNVRSDQVCAELHGLSALLNQNFTGLPVTEVFEHGVLKVMRLCYDKTNAKEPMGILTPISGGDVFYDFQKVMNDFSRQFEWDETQPYSEYEAPVSQEWQSLNKDARELKVKQGIVSFCNTSGYAPEAFHLQQLSNDLDGYPVRIFIELDDQKVDFDKRPEIIRQLEKYLKAALEKKLQVFYIERPDFNRIRRL